MPTKNCLSCRKLFHFRPSEDKRDYPRKYCSFICYRERKITTEEKSALYNKIRASLKKVVHTEEWNKKVALSKWREKNPNWVNGYSSIYGFGWNRKLKEQVRQRDEYKCRLCGRERANNQQSFPVHHIDLSKTNHSPENLVTLCRHCHREVHRGKMSSAFRR